MGLKLLFDHAGHPGNPGQSAAHWPADSRLKTLPGLPRLLLFAHPHCSCTRASLGELESLLQHAPTALQTTVFFVLPVAAPSGWEQTESYRAAQHLPGVQVVADVDGVEARRFGAITSGQANLYSAAGELQFSGGITGARGHRGDNVGKARILDLLAGRPVARRNSAVYGCRLQKPAQL